MVLLSKATLVAKLKAKGFLLRIEHMQEVDRNLKRNNGMISDLSVIELARSWGWTDEAMKQLRMALK